MQRAYDHDRDEGADHHAIDDHLCSAPCKALRFAPTALTRGLRALTVPARRSRSGSCVMAGGNQEVIEPASSHRIRIGTANKLSSNRTASCQFWCRLIANFDR